MEWAQTRKKCLQVYNALEKDEDILAFQAFIAVRAQ